MRHTILLSLTASLITTLAWAQDYTIGNIVIEQPVARATPANAPVSAGYMTIRNTGQDDDTLVSGTVNFAQKTELHEMTMENDVMKMREIESGIAIPAGGDVQLMPGGLHMMFMGMTEQLAEGQTHTATLVFEKAGTIEVMLDVQSLATIRDNMKAPAMKMNHDGHGSSMAN